MPVIALTNARAIDGTGVAARPNPTVLIRDGHRRDRRRSLDDEHHVRKVAMVFKAGVG